VGGLANARAMHDLCHDHDISGLGRCMPESGSPRRGSPWRGSQRHSPDRHRGDRTFFLDDVTQPRSRWRRRTITVPTGPGIGFTVDEAAIKRLTVEEKVFAQVGRGPSAKCKLKSAKWQSGTTPQATLAVGALGAPGGRLLRAVSVTAGAHAD